MVVVAIGVRPNVKLAKEAGLKIGTTGAIAVDEYLRTSVTPTSTPVVTVSEHGFAHGQEGLSPTRVNGE